MAFETNELSGALFKNDRKTKENQPDYQGNCKIDDTEYWVAGWIKTPKGGGNKYMSLAFTEKEAPSTQQAPAHDIDFDDDIPF
jgi:hypothetical protein